ncbi:uncharacterized protein V1518DRAFT_410745 [Limtongia smithiae]|uniref:uncharacterized protein n=1 Tax=Limtongia smithiae TaxID=1125753 RepID=UPI0034CF6CB2
MASSPQPTPKRFPWPCKALYSWSGEEDTDLGFIEGDIIDCLNLGDGQWWLGKLRRNNVRGYFPCNFVTLLDDPSPTVPALSRSVSPAPSQKSPRSTSPAPQHDVIRDSYTSSGYYDTKTGVYQNLDYGSSDHEDDGNYASAPLPPPHKVAYRPKSSLSMRSTREPTAGYDDDEDIAKSRPVSPIHLAMDDVIEALRKMGTEDLPVERHHIRPSSAHTIRRQQLERESNSRQTARRSMLLDSDEDENQSPRPPFVRSHTEGVRTRRSLLRPKSTLGIHIGRDELLRTDSTDSHSLHGARSVALLRTLKRSSTVKTASTASNGVSVTSHSTNNTGLTDISATSAGSLARRRAINQLLSNETSAPVSSPKSYEVSSTKPIVLSDAASETRSTSDYKSSIPSLKMKKSAFFSKVKSSFGNISSNLSNASTMSSASKGYSAGLSSQTSYSSASYQPAQSNVKDPMSAAWIHAQTGLHRAKSMSQNEREERRRRHQLNGYTVSNPLNVLYDSVDGDEGADGEPVGDGMDVSKFHFMTLDKSVRGISIPSLSTLSSFTQTVLCRPYKSDIQRLRAIYIFCTERIIWHYGSAIDDEFEDVVYDAARIFQTKEANADEMAVCFQAMCNLVQIPCEIVRGYLRAPGEVVNWKSARMNHTWNAVVVDNEWRLVDASLASPTHPKRSLYTNDGAVGMMAEDFYFLAKPSELLFTHIPKYMEQEHVVPPAAHQVLLDLPSICPGMFRQQLYLSNFDTSLLHMIGTDVVQVEMLVPADVDCVAEVEVRGYCVDADGDLMESGEVQRLPALAQPYWVHGRRVFRTKAVLPTGEKSGVLKIYAGRRGMMQSAHDRVYPLAVALPITHEGKNAPFNFVQMHPTPQAQRYDVYVVQPQCLDLIAGSTIMFDVKQFPNNVESPVFSPSKQAKFAIQSPSGKITRLTARDDGGDNVNLTGKISWEALLVVNEVGVYRGLIMADRGTAWCIFAEWQCQQNLPH